MVYSACSWMSWRHDGLQIRLQSLSSWVPLTYIKSQTPSRRNKNDNLIENCINAVYYIAVHAYVVLEEWELYSLPYCRGKQENIS
jgi:hypothetical protein